jgi:uncharacterized membrane protein
MGAFDPSEEWLHRPDVWSGAALGAWLAARSFGPSLMPRGTTHQALVSGASAATGFAVGNATYGIIGGGLPLRHQLPAFATAAGVGLAGKLALAPRPDEDLERATLRAVSEGLLAGSSACLAVGILRRSRHRRATAAAILALGVAASATGVYRDLRAQLDRRDDADPPPPRPLPAVAQSATVAGVIAATVNGYRHSGQALGRMVRQRFGLSPRASEIAGRVGAAVAWSAVIAAFADTFVRGMELYDRVMDPGYDTPPSTPARSAGPGSKITFSRTGRQGRRFILDAPDADAIEAVMGRPCRAEPVRVFVGYDMAATAEARVAYALEELARTGAYDRAVLIVGSPAGTGVVDTVPFETADHVLLGDCAGVSVQYERLPSLLALQKATAGGRHHRLLLEGIHAALAERAPERRPRLVVYGESLGAWAGQDAFLGGGVHALDELGVERALWVGTPYYSGWRRQAEVPGAVPPGSVLEVSSVAPLRALGAEARARLRVVLLSHDNDPVRHLCADLFVRRPDWLDGVRPPGVSPRQRYAPAITAFQTLVDTANATHQVPGIFRATGHDYRADLPAVTVEAFGLPEPTDEQWAALMERLQADEAARAARFRRPDDEEEIEAVAAASVGTSLDLRP